MSTPITQIPNPFIPLLLSTRVHHICPQTPIVSINAYNTIEELQSLLRRHSVHSIPVLENGQCIGMVDGLNIAKFFFIEPETYPKRSQKTKVISLLTQNTAPLPVFAKTSLLDVISIVAPGVHRAIVLQSESNHSLFSVCSESDIIATIYCYLHVNGPLEINNPPVHMLSQFPIRAFSNYFARIKFHIKSTDSMKIAVESVQKALIMTTTQHQAGVVNTTTTTSTTNNTTTTSTNNNNTTTSTTSTPAQSTSPNSNSSSILSTNQIDSISTSTTSSTMNNDDQPSSNANPTTTTTTPSSSSTTSTNNTTTTNNNTTTTHNNTTTTNNTTNNITTTTIAPLITPHSDHPSLEWNAPIVVVVENNCIIGYLNTTVIHRNVVNCDDVENMSLNLSKSVQHYLQTSQQLTTISTPPTTTTTSNFIHEQEQSQQSTQQQQDPTPSLSTPSPPQYPPLSRSSSTIQQFSHHLGYVVSDTIPFGLLLQLFTRFKLDYVWVSSCVQEHYQLLDVIPFEWYENNCLGMITINDLLRLISRDNIAIYPHLLPTQLE